MAAENACSKVRMPGTLPESRMPQVVNRNRPPACLPACQRDAYNVIRRLLSDLHSWMRSSSSRSSSSV